MTSAMRTQPAVGASGPQQGGPAARTLFVLGLVVIAALSSLLWWLIRHDPQDEAGLAGGNSGQSGSQTPGTSDGGPTTSEAPPTLQAGRFTYEGLAPVHTTDSCAEVSYGKVASWFGKNACERVARALFSVKDGDARAAVSVSVVTMPKEGKAKSLKKVTDTSGTGNVSDLLSDGTVSVPGAPKVAGGTYASNHAGNQVTIVESAFFGDTKNKALLEEITTSALQLAPKL